MAANRKFFESGMAYGSYLTSTTRISDTSDKVEEPRAVKPQLKSDGMKKFSSGRIGNPYYSDACSALRQPSE